MKSYYVYKHTLPNGKVYIGITHTTPLVRWQKGNGYKRQCYFYNAILKYGWDNIIHEILFAGLTKEEAEAKEIELIAKYKSNNKKYGYNIANGGNSVGKQSLETRKKISKAQKGENCYWYGKHRAEETKRKISEAHKGKKNPNYGKPLSKEARENISKFHSVKVVCIETGQIFNSMAEAEKTLGLCKNSISAYCQGRRKTVGGYHWAILPKADRLKYGSRA